MSELINFALIIPTYQEKESLVKLLPQLIMLYPSAPIFIVDDHSQDGTASYLANFTQDHPHLHLTVRDKKMGRGGAVLTGLKKAFENKETEYFLEMDADFSHDPNQIERLLKKADSRTVVIGSRYVTGSQIVGWPQKRRILSKLANLYAKTLLSIPINDYTNGFRLYSRLAVKKIIQSPLFEKGYALLSEIAYLLYRDGFTFVEVPTTFINRKWGKSHTDFAEYLRSLLAILHIRFLFK